MRYGLFDNQQQIDFLRSQLTHVESTVYRIQYPEIMYPRLMPIDTSANEWARSVTFYSMDRVGMADWFDANATSLPLADISRDRREQGIEMAAIGYRYNLEELGVAMLVPGTNLSTERAEAARKAYEEFIDRLVRTGDTRKRLTGLFNNPYVTRVDAIADGTGSSALWSTKTADQIIRDVQNALTQVYTGSNTVEMADTVLLPISAMNLLASIRVPNTYGNALDYLTKYNMWTHQTQQPLTILGVLGLDTAGRNGTSRMVVYRRDPQILKLHLPMPHRFLPVWQTGPMVFDIPGIFRVGSVEIRRPAAVAYVDGI
jgi:hypothetical protein